MASVIAMCVYICCRCDPFDVAATFMGFTTLHDSGPEREIFTTRACVCVYVFVRALYAFMLNFHPCLENQTE